MFASLVPPLARPETPGAFYGGFRLVGLESTVYDVPDSDADAATFARPAAGPRGDGASPQIRTLSPVELGTHLEPAFVARSIAHGERAMVGGWLRHRTPEMGVLWDRGFFSYQLRHELMARDVEALARVTNRLILKPIRNLADGSYRAKIDRTAYDRQKDRDGIIVRVIRYTLDDPQRVGHGEVHVLITDLLDEDLYPATELIMLYPERWEQELVHDEQKTHRDPRRATKPTHLRSETPAGVIQEVYALSPGHFVTRALMFAAAPAVGLDPDRLSFLGRFQILRCRLPECNGATPQSFEAWYQSPLWEMQQERTDDAVRRNRVNPRVIKRKMSKFKKQQPQHRHRSPLKKAFVETIVMLR